MNETVCWAYFDPLFATVTLSMITVSGLSLSIGGYFTLTFTIIGIASNPHFIPDNFPLGSYLTLKALANNPCLFFEISDNPNCW